MRFVIGWNEVLTDVGDVKQLTDGLKWVLDQSEENWKRLSLNAYLTVKDSTWAESAKLLEQSLERACRSARPINVNDLRFRKVRCLHGALLVLTLPLELNLV